MKVLVVDDSPTMRRIVINALQRIGYADTVEAPDGLTALGKLNSAVGLIITDWSMPEMSGPDFTRAVRAHPNGRSVPILMVTTRGARDEIISAVDAGVTSYIHKPFTPPVLKEKIERVLAGAVAAA
jgi:two-component system, chemotaxis family, chemotaxis protein CheY